MFFRNRKSLLVRFALMLTLLIGLVGRIQAEPVRAATFTVTNTNDSGCSNSMVVNSTITQNQAGINGGALFLQGSAGIVSKNQEHV